MAPTGIAASILRVGSTAHSFFDLPIAVTTLPPLNHLKLTKLRIRLEGVVLLIIDEISMVSSTILSWYNQRLQDALGNTKPFGGISIVACGDCCQLPSVGALS